jgi:hypothetical protein
MLRDGHPIGVIAVPRAQVGLFSAGQIALLQTCAMAEECFRWAQHAQTEDKREAYLDVARTWLEAASGQDYSPPTQTPTLWPLNPKH